MMRVLAMAGCGVMGVSLSACESTEQESAKLNQEGQQLLAGQGALKLGAVNHSVKISDVSLLTSSGRAAVAMRLTGTSTSGQVNVPVLVNVSGPGGKLLYSNETGGLEASLQHVSLPRTGQPVWWVDDQVLLPQGASDSSAKVSVHVGDGTGSARSDGRRSARDRRPPWRAGRPEHRVGEARRPASEREQQGARVRGRAARRPRRGGRSSPREPAALCTADRPRFRSSWWATAPERACS